MFILIEQVSGNKRAKKEELPMHMGKISLSARSTAGIAAEHGRQD